MQNRCAMGEQKRKHTAGQMKPVHRGKNVNERTAGAAGQMKASRGEFAPNRKLSGKKQQTENGSQAEPWEVALLAQRNARNRLHWGERSGSRDFAPRHVDREAACDQDGCVGQQ